MYLILASTSPWRRDLLLRAGLVCECVASGVREDEVQAATPQGLAVARARAKALTVSRERAGPQVVVVGADQVAHLAGEMFGKPADAAAQLARLKQLRGRTHQLVTGVSLVGPRGEHSFSSTTHVTFRADLTDQELLDYVGTGEGSGCAGGYQAESLGGQLIERIDGDWNNVIGLPLFELITALRGWGLEMPSAQEDQR